MGSLSSDPEVLQTAKGMDLKFEKTPTLFSVEYEILNKQKSTWYRKNLRKFWKMDFLRHVNMSKGNSYPWPV